LLKPNISSMVGKLYSTDDQARRDAGFSIFYMGINIGGLLGPLTAGALGEKVNWEYGFAAAGIGMALGLVQYKLTGKHLGTVGLNPNIHPDPAVQKRKIRNIRAGLCLFVVLLIAFVASLILGWLSVDPDWIAHTALYALAGCAVAFLRDTLAPQYEVQIDDITAVASATSDLRGLLAIDAAAPELTDLALDIKVTSSSPADRTAAMFAACWKIIWPVRV